jgi:hypothetical protein
MDAKLTSIGYDLEPSRYAPLLGFSRLRVLISDKPTQRFFDVKQMSLPTFDGRFLHHTQVTRHELSPSESFQVSVGELRLETHQGETLQAFTLGGNLRATVVMGDLYCEFTSNAPILKVDDDTNSVNRVIADELADLLAENESSMAGHEDELYTRLSKFDPYTIFLSCLVSLQALVDNVPMGVRRERFHKASANIQRAIQIVRETDGWDGHSPSLEELLSSGGVS